MDVTRDWRRSALGAGGVALLLPLGLAIGVALTAAFGGTATLHALGQVFAGPSTPGASGGAAGPGLESARDVPSVPVRVRRTGAQQGASGPGGSNTSPGSPPSRTGQPQTDRSSAPGGSHSTTPPATDPAGGGRPRPPSTPPPAPESSVLHQVGEQAVGIAKGLPGPVGGAAGDAAQTVVDLIP